MLLHLMTHFKTRSYSSVLAQNTIKMLVNDAVCGIFYHNYFVILFKILLMYRAIKYFNILLR